MSDRICKLGACTFVLMILAVAASPPATADPGDWINFVDQTSTRIVVDPADPSVGIGDTGEKDMAVGDLDKDGDLDLVIVRKQPAYGPALRNVLYMNENGIMVERTSTLAPALLDVVPDRDVVIVDVNGDTWPDVVTAATLGVRHRVYMNLGQVAGVWQGLSYNAADNRIPPGLAGTFCGVAAGLVNNDQHVDLYFAGYLGMDDMLLINDGNGFFTLDPQGFNDTGFGVGAQIIDLNGDGANDIIKVNSTNGIPVNPMVVVYYNNPLNPGQFGAAVDLIDRASADPYMFMAGELNNQGNPEVYIIRDSQDTYLINTGNDPGTGFATFSELTVQNSTNTNAFGGNIRLVDWDGDGFLEPVVATFNAEDPMVCPAMNPVRRLAALRNLGGVPNVTLSDPLDPATRFWNTFDTHDIAVFDIDGDGLLDMWSGTCTGNNVFMGVATGACCLPDGSCSVLTNTECIAQCGLYRGDGVGCAGTVCPLDVPEACCLPGNSCLDLFPCLCAQQGGVSQGIPTTCADPGICNATGACCLPNGGGCITTTQEDCLNRCGEYRGDGSSCLLAPCLVKFSDEIINSPPSSPVPPAVTVAVILGACCFADETCSDISECNCNTQGGTFQGPGTTCASVVCGGGQCCILAPPFTCTDDVLQGDCLADCGVWTDLFTCSQVQCPLFVAGACCLEDVCVDGASQGWCECQGGVYRGDLTECSCITTCGPPNGACCTPGGTCVENTFDECNALCGSFSGEGSVCSQIVACPVIFPILGACCLLDGTCADTSRCGCESQGGLWQGGSTDCAGTTCPAVCGGFLGIPCLDVNEFCKLGEGECCCDFQGFCTPVPRLCTALFDPVCGCDGITYGNACNADAARVTILHQGECTGSCCLPEGVCVDGLTETECTCQCGEYGGNNNLCAASTCVPPVEACCFPFAPCTDLVPCECIEQGGTPQGALGTCANLPPNTCPFCDNALTEGCWGGLMQFQVTSVNMIGLKTGKVMVMHRDFAFNSIFQAYQIFDPGNDSIGPFSTATVLHNMYCSGFDQLPDGRILIAGGLLGNDRSFATIYDPDLDEQGANAWSAQQNMSAARFYPTLTSLSDGTVLAIGGSGAGADTPEIFREAGLPGFQWTPLPGSTFSLPNYPFMHGLSDGRWLFAGTGNGGSPQFSRLLNLVLDDLRPLGDPNSVAGSTAVMFRKDLVMKVEQGGNGNVYIIDMGCDNPVWQQQFNTLNVARFGPYAIALPDGKVLVVGGSSVAARAAELYDPDTGVWTLMASMAETRSDHSSSILLRDGRVMIAGASTTAEIYSPPYMFNPGRPTITSVVGSAADVIQYGKPFVVSSPEEAAIDSVRLIRLGAATHSWNMGQQSMELHFVSSGTGTLKVASPAQPFEASPGYFMLFVSVGGVPSEGTIVKLEL